jgi:hypothetical protein
MYILFYGVIFVAIGMMIGKLVKKETTSFGLIAVITVIWFFIMGPWAIATFFELVFGYSLVADKENKSAQKSEPVKESKSFTNKVVEAFEDDDDTSNWVVVIVGGIGIGIYVLFNL